ncbi:elongation factor G-like protein EF-G2 [Amycolatopsis sp. WAC 01375]|uniref:elongation factor G-like protein EF-G2 n=1 Tax=unclassified Amycolatopsis TaxID=2618356 RepID=UPI000F771FA9|nr:MULTISPECIES: elongation factor G-like protein EF-G2 [unclassified Amycolatopsis]RSM73341.1 elongation factor G-like protein EF-G2 [Amycolatopsis sp. WAC 01375]RSN22773.1 elongation factor G-like protein EF-G2 [Amycolatopsis sp. WAC 01416]
MADKQSKNGDSGAAVAVDDPAKVRNVVLVGPSGSGKTTLAEALLAASGTVTRAGSVVEGTTVCDHDPAAVRQQRSVGLSVAPVLHQGHKINLIDTPGYADFVGELRAGLRAADAALFVVCAAEGVDAATVAVWEECAAVGMPRAVVVSRLDHHRADPEGEIAACQEAFGAGVLPLYLPARDGLVGLITRRYFDYSNGFPPEVGEPDEADLARMTEARNELIEGVIAESEDESLMDRYLSGEEISEDTLIADLETAVARGSFHPVIPVCATTGVGLAEVLDGIVRAFPSPLEHVPPEVTSPTGEPHAGLRADPDGPLAAEVVRTAVDSYVGRVSLVRVFSGTLRPERPVHVSGHGLAERGHEDHDTDERVAHLYSPLGANLREVPYCVAGDLCALTKVGSAETGDTVSSPEDPLIMKPWAMPEPLLPVAVIAKTRSDEDTLARNLSRLVAGDPTLRLDRNAETNQLVLWCMGEAHADVVLSRLRAGGADVDTEPVRISLRSTFAGPGRGHGRHVKQSGGHGQFAVCDIEVQPLPRGSGFEFVDKVVGGSVPHQFIPSVEKGVRAQAQRGIVDDHPLIDIRVTLVDGKAHSVDSSDAAFQTAGALALKEAAAAAKIALLEPLEEVAVRLPDEHLGTVLGDLSSRRGRVLGTESGEGGRTVIRAEVPAVELLRYAIDLRSLTSGTATFTRRHARFEPMPEGAVALH